MIRSRHTKTLWTASENFTRNLAVLLIPLLARPLDLYEMVIEGKEYFQKETDRINHYLNEMNAVAAHRP